MARTIIDIPDMQLREVDNLCKLLGISRAEAVRRALLDFVQSNDDVRADGFGLWKDAASGAQIAPGLRKGVAKTGRGTR